MPRPEQYPEKKLIGFTSETVERVEEWRRRQPSPMPNFSEAVRRLVDAQLDASGIE
jgi:hypothetical protein